MRARVEVFACVAVCHGCQMHVPKMPNKTNCNWIFGHFESIGEFCYFYTKFVDWISRNLTLNFACFTKVAPAKTFICLTNSKTDEHERNHGNFHLIARSGWTSYRMDLPELTFSEAKSSQQCGCCRQEF